MKHRVLIPIFLALGVLFASVPKAQAQDASAIKEAQALFDEAQGKYLAGLYDESAALFQKAYGVRDFPQFLYNAAAAYHMKAKKEPSLAAYTGAVEYYKKYLAAEPAAKDRAKIEKTIGVLEAEIAKLKAAEAALPPPDPANPNPTPTPVAAAPSQEVQALGDVKVQGVVVIDSEPRNASIYLDDRKNGPIGTTPWTGKLDGNHLVIVEKRGYAVAESRHDIDPSKFYVLFSTMTKADNLGWVEIKSNVPGASIFLDDKSVGAIGQTPFSFNAKPGRHTVWVSTEGYDEVEHTIDVIAGENHEWSATLKGSPVGYLDFSGPGIEESSIYVDGKQLCQRGPCRKGVQEGVRQVEVSRPGHKPYRRRITVVAKTETTIRVNLVKKPGRGDAIFAYVVAAGAAGGGIYLGMQSNDLRDALRAEIDAGMPPPASDDPRFARGKYYAIGANAAYGVAGISGLLALYYTFREKGAPSTGTVDSRALAITPHITPGYAGLGMEVKW